MIKSIYSKIPKELSRELIENIASSNEIKIERIISKGHKTPKDSWYNQDKREFVLLIKGSAELLFYPNKLVKMKEGDYIIIPAHKKHRVENTSTKTETIWLTVFY